MRFSTFVALASAISLSTAQDGPTEPDTDPNCEFFDTAVDETFDCTYFEKNWGISHENFVAWNPSVNDDCSGIKVGNSYCVEAPPPQVTSTTKTTSSTGPTTTPKPSPTQEGLIDTCTSFYKAVKGDTCDKIVQKYGTFSASDFQKWNPAVGDDCSGLWAETYYCVGIPGTPTAQPSSMTSATTTGSPKPSPTQDGLIKTCVTFYKAVKGDTCDKIVKKYGTFTLAQFKTWNPAVGDDCSGIWAETYYCVGIPGTPTAKPSSTKATTTTTGTPKPSPTQDGLIKTCVAFYKAIKGDTCDKIVQKYGTFTLAQFKTWNPAVGSDCSGLWAETYYCVGIPGTPTTKPTSTSTKPTSTKGNGVTTPTPTQPGMVGNCKSFYLVKSGDTCDSIAKAKGITTAQLIKWNTGIGSDCKGLWGSTYVCIGLI